MENFNIKKLTVYFIMALFLVSNVSALNLSNDFNIDAPDTLRFAHGKDREFVTIELNNTNISESYKCISYIAENSTEKYIIQTNPTYRNKSDATIKLFNTPYENREFFNIENRIGKVYYTKENLVIDGRNYVIGVECSSDKQKVTAESLVKVEYEDWDAPITRFVWLSENLFEIIFSLLIIAIVLALITIGVRTLRK